jgi:periplasmic divalent cation tolerance protein
MENCKESDILSVTTTVGSLADAQALARRIVAARLAACVQVDEGVQSFYRWEGKDCEEAEVRLTIKTVTACVQALQALFAQAHPYQVPQFLTVPMRASPAYAAWVRAEVAGR